MKNVYTNGELCLIWLDSFLGLEYKNKKEIYKFITEKSNLKQLILDNKDVFVNLLGNEKYNLMVNSANKEYLDFVLNGLEKEEVRAITIVSKNYPQSLLNTETPPLVLYAKGNINLLSTPCFTVVGSRKTLTQALAQTEKFVTELSKHFTIVTGNADGVDNKVLTTCLENNFNVITVLAGGINNIYPKTSVNLVEKVAKTGLVLTEFFQVPSIQPFNFPIRNRILAGLSKGILITSAGKKSGAIYTADYALEYGKEVFAFPYSIGVPSGEGCNDIIKRGGILADSVTDILSFYNFESKTINIQLTESEKLVVDAINNGFTHIEQISKELNIGITQLTTVLAMLEINGVVCKTGVNQYAVI